MPLILDGKIVRENILLDLKSKIERLSIKPKLCIFVVGDDSRSNIYINEKRRQGEKIGINVDINRLSRDSKTEDVIKAIEKSNSDSNTHGIIVQLPMPEHIDKNIVISTISPEKDVDGLTPYNFEKLMRNDSPFLIPATAKGIVMLLDFYKVKIKDKKIAVLGRSNLVGTPTAQMLKILGGDVTICHSKTENIPEITKKSDIIVVAIGKSELVDKTYIGNNKPVIVDVGINPILDTARIELEGKKVVGDVKFNEVAILCGAITPVPGGVGPLTVTALLQNVFLAACDTLAKRTSR